MAVCHTLLSSFYFRLSAYFDNGLSLLPHVIRCLPDSAFQEHRAAGVFIEQILPGSIVRKLTDEEMDAYRAPFADPAAREPIYRFPNELPIAGAPADVWAMASAYHEWLLDTEIPKLLFWADPGSFISPTRAAWLQSRLKACRSVALGPGRHYLQEDHPDVIGREIANWLPDL